MIRIKAVVVIVGSNLLYSVSDQLFQTPLGLEPDLLTNLMMRMKAVVVIEGSNPSYSEFDLMFQTLLSFDFKLLTNCSTSDLVFDRKSLDNVGPTFNSEIHFLRVTACVSGNK